MNPCLSKICITICNRLYKYPHSSFLYTGIICRDWWCVVCCIMGDCGTDLDYIYWKRHYTVERCPPHTVQVAMNWWRHPFNSSPSTINLEQIFTELVAPEWSQNSPAVQLLYCVYILPSNGCGWYQETPTWSGLLGIDRHHYVHQVVRWRPLGKEVSIKVSTPTTEARHTQHGPYGGGQRHRPYGGGRPSVAVRPSTGAHKHKIQN